MVSRSLKFGRVTLINVVPLFKDAEQLASDVLTKPGTHSVAEYAEAYQLESAVKVNHLRPFIIQHPDLELWGFLRGGGRRPAGGHPTPPSCPLTF